MIRTARRAHFPASPHPTKAMCKKLHAHTVTDGGIQHAILHLRYQGCLQVWHQGAHQQCPPCAHPHCCAPPGVHFNRCKRCNAAVQEKPTPYRIEGDLVGRTSVTRNVNADSRQQAIPVCKCNWCDCAGGACNVPRRQ